MDHCNHVVSASHSIGILEFPGSGGRDDVPMCPPHPTKEVAYVHYFLESVVVAGICPVTEHLYKLIQCGNL